MRLCVIPLTLLMTACSISATDKAVNREASDGALCEGLNEPVDSFAASLLYYKKDTPDEVIIRGTRVVKGYDSECS